MCKVTSSYISESLKPLWLFVDPARSSAPIIWAIWVLMLTFISSGICGFERCTCPFRWPPENNIKLPSLKWFLHFCIWWWCKIKFNNVTTLLLRKKIWYCQITQTDTVTRWCGDAVHQAVSLCYYNMTLRWFNSGQKIYLH